MSTAVIGRVLIRRPAGLDADPTGAAVRRLAALELQPGGVAPSAVLVIRRLDDPAPGTLRLHGPGDRSSDAWSAAVEARVAGFAGSAARPADGAVPAAAEAVLFRDRVELLACLAEAGTRPESLDAWWWRGLGVGSGGVVAAWLRELLLVPAVVDLLERRGSLRALHQIPDPDLVRLASAVAATAGLPALARAAALPAGAPDALARPAPGRAAPGGRDVATPRRSVVARIPALGDLRAVSGPALALAAVALAVHRRPDLARDPGFAAAVARLAGTPPLREPGRPDAASDSIVTASGAAPAEPPRASRPVPPAAGAPPPRPFVPAPGSRPAAAGRAPRGRGTDGAAAQVDRPAAPVILAADPHGAPEGELTSTGLGGVFSLLVLALDLGLYGDFSRPAEPGLGLDPWDLVTMLATELGARDRRPDDPAWTLLAGLAGRPAIRRPGTGWRPPATWRIPGPWLTSVGPGRSWSWWHDRGRLRVQDARGFAVLDGRFDARSASDVHARLGAALRAGAPTRIRHGRTDAPDRPRAADRWVAELGGFVRAWLSPRLLVRDDAGLRRVLLERPARVFVGPGSCDVVLALAELPVVVRAAGLDRDLGPVPAARRALRFHYR